MSKRDSEYLKRSNMTNWHSFIPSIMTARQQSLTAKIPRYAALYFPNEDTTGVAPSSHITTGRLEKDSEVLTNWDGEEVTAVIISLSNSRAELEEAIETFIPPASTPTHDEIETTANNASKSKEPANTSKNTTRNNKKKDPKPTVTTLSSGKPSQEPHDVDSVPPAAFQVDESVQSCRWIQRFYVYTRHPDGDNMC